MPLHITLQEGDHLISPARREFGVQCGLNRRPLTALGENLVDFALDYPRLVRILPCAVPVDCTARSRTSTDDVQNVLRTAPR